MSTRGGKDKGHQNAGLARNGIARLRRAHSKSRTRPGNLQRLELDEDLLLKHSDDAHADTSGTLLARFNQMSAHLNQASNDTACVNGEVCGFEGPTIVVRFDDGEEIPCQLRRRIKKLLRGEKSPLAIGDRVRVSTTAEGDRVIEGVHPRDNQLVRRDSHNASLDHVFAANVDALVVVSAVRDPHLKTGLIDRYLLIAALADIPAVVVINKCDLAESDTAAELYKRLHIPVFCTSTTSPHYLPEIAALRQHLRGRACVFAGHSGVGKSSLINALYPQFQARVGDVSQVLHKGRHTTTSARSYLLDDGSRLIDTPGIRELGVRVATAVDAALLYSDIAHYHPQCRFPNCSHTHEPDCAVKQAVRDGHIALSRYGSFISLLAHDLGMDVSGSRDLLKPGDLDAYAGVE
ncbi:MAG: ribosome small subunit-dependent GTPase A [Planctomycetota bacterium]|nr:MAG: ribosome small subunit-dependent GTPase A [Planctomycetota bacterium]